MSISPLRQRMIGDMTARHIGEGHAEELHPLRQELCSVHRAASWRRRQRKTCGCTAFIWWRDVTAADDVTGERGVFFHLYQRALTGHRRQ